MKKLIAILVVFALVAGAAFAETAMGGSAEVRWTIAENSGADNAKTLTSGAVEAVGFQMSTANDEGTFGGMGKFVFWGHGPNVGHGTAGNRGWEIGPSHHKWDRVFAWWQPIPQVKFFLGFDGDGQFNTANLSRWGHHQMDRGISVEDWDASDFLIGNWDDFGMALIITPMDGLALNLAMNIPQAKTDVEDWLKESIQFQVVYAIPDIGTVYFTYNNFSGEDGLVGLTFHSGSLVDGLAFEVGGSFDLDADDDAVNFGVGVHYSGDGFGVKARAFFWPNDDFYVKADIMPWVDLGFATLYCNIRVVTGARDYHGEDATTDLGWHVNPYLRLNVGVGDFRIGALIGDERAKDEISFKLAMSMLVSF